MTIVVTEDNFVRAETNRMLVGLQAQAGGVNVWKHHREPVRLDEQTVIRTNRDTLYSMTVANISDEATLIVPMPATGIDGHGGRPGPLHQPG